VADCRKIEATVKGAGENVREMDENMIVKHWDESCLWHSKDPKSMRD